MQKANKKFITVSWRAGREPVDDMFWCEAEYDGAWMNITSIDRLRSRREVVERVSELENAIIGFDFAFSFPKSFIDFLRAEGIGSDWYALAKKIREDLKRNTDDGVRIWIEQIGKYRESNLETPEDANRFTVNYFREGKRNVHQEDLRPYERRSLAERYRRIGMILKRKDPSISSTLTIRYNKLTARYEFADTESRGRASLMGIAMLEQLKEAKPEIAIWPFMKPAALTVVEIYPKMFANMVANDQESLRKFFDVEEDNALFISREVRELVYANPKAHETIFALLGIIKAERREDKLLRPLRDYRDYFYDNDEIRAEGWSYGIGFKEPEKKQKEISLPPKEKAELAPVTDKIATEVPVEEPFL